MRCFERAIEIDPSSFDAHCGLGAAYWSQGEDVLAGAMWLRATQLNPDEAAAHSNLAVVLQKLGRPVEAEVACRRALRIAPNLASAHGNLGMALRDQGRAREAELACLRAISLDPTVPEYLRHLGTALDDQGRLAESIVAYRKALVLRPDYPQAHHDMALALLKDGRFAEGWSEYEWRWWHNVPRRTISNGSVAWSGEDLDGKSILLRTEQGLGDAIQFVRYARLLAGRGARVVVEAPDPLRRVFATVPGVQDVVADGRGASVSLPPTDFHLAAMSAPRLFNTALASIPAEVPYIFPNRDQATERAKLLGALPGLKIGLAWAGKPVSQPSSKSVFAHRRNIALATLAPILSMPDVSSVSLQVGVAGEEVAELPQALRPIVPIPAIADFADTAAVIANLDLVISIDTSVAHLAGAMAKPVWILVGFESSWRWMLNRDDSPWYPTARLFRQHAPGDWSGVVERVLAALAEVATPPRLR